MYKITVRYVLAEDEDTNRVRQRTLRSATRTDVVNMVGTFLRDTPNLELLRVPTVGYVFRQKGGYACVMPEQQTQRFENRAAAATFLTDVCRAHIERAVRIEVGGVYTELRKGTTMKDSLGYPKTTPKGRSQDVGKDCIQTFDTAPVAVRNTCIADAQARLRKRMTQRHIEAIFNARVKLHHALTALEKNLDADIDAFLPMTEVVIFDEFYDQKAQVFRPITEEGMQRLLALYLFYAEPMHPTNVVDLNDAERLSQ